MTSPAQKPKSESARRMAEINAMPADRVTAATTALIDTALAFCLFSPMPPPMRTDLLARMASVLHDIEGVVEGPAYGVRMAADRLVVAARRGGPMHYLELSLRDRLADMFTDRAAAALVRWQRSSGSG